MKNVTQTSVFSSTMRRQQGAALVVSLIILLMLTVVGLSAIRDSGIQERMAGNSRDMNTAFQAAELALREAEAYLTGASIGPFNGSGLYRICGIGESSTACSSPSWSDLSSTGWIKLTNTPEGADQSPQYFIEENPLAVDTAGSLVSDTPNETYEMYHITARGFGSSDGSVVVLQSTYRRG